MTWPADTFRHFWRHFAESAPWLLGGAVVGVALNRWIKTEWVERWMQTGRTPVIAATALYVVAWLLLAVGGGLLMEKLLH